MFHLLALLPLLPLLQLTTAQYTATYDPSNLPDKSEDGSYGTNQCGTQSSQTSKCQNAFINSVEDFCLWGPPESTSPLGDGTSKIGNVEEIVVSYCLKEGYGTRLLPAGAVTSAHFVKVVSDQVSYVQVSGSGDFTKILIPAGDEGGELDPHSWTGLGNPQGGLVFTNAFSGSYEQTHEWTSFMSANDYCFRACRDGPNAAGWCEHIYDVLSCDFTIPGERGPGFDQCDGAPAEQPGVYGGSTFHQDDPTTPAPHPPGPTSQCTTFSSVGGGTANLAAVATTNSTTASATSNSTSATSTQSSSSSRATSVISTTTAAATGSATSPPASSNSNAAATAAASTSSRAGAMATSVPVGAGAVVMAAAAAALLL